MWIVQQKIPKITDWQVNRFAWCEWFGEMMFIKLLFRQFSSSRKRAKEREREIVRACKYLHFYSRLVWKLLFISGASFKMPLSFCQHSLSSAADKTLCLSVELRRLVLRRFSFCCDLQHFGFVCRMDVWLILIRTPQWRRHDIMMLTFFA